MHILHINLSKELRGGERQTALLIDGLAKNKSYIEQSLMARFDSLLPGYLKTKENIPLIKIKRPYLLSLLKIKQPFDIIHAHEAKACHLAYLVNSRYGTPFVITRRIDKAPKNSWPTRKIYQNCSCVVSLSSAIENTIKDYNPAIKSTIISDVYASLPYSDKAVQTIRKSFGNKVLIGHVGALVKKDKGQQFTIEAARALEKRQPNVHFILLGEGYDEKALKTQANGLKNIDFLGFKSNIGDYLHAFDIFVFPSLKEGLGSTLLDAMHAQLPIIASNVGGIPDIIRDKDNGLLIPPGNSNAIVEAILKLLADPQLSTTLAKQGRSEIERYSPEVISQRYMDIYNSIISTHRM